MTLKLRRKSDAHPGFASVADTIAREQGIDQDRANAELAAATRRASPAAMAANPRLKRVKLTRRGV